MSLSLGQGSTESPSGPLSQQGSQMQETNLILGFCFLSLLVFSEAFTDEITAARPWAAYSDW